MSLLRFSSYQGCFRETDAILDSSVSVHPSNSVYTSSSHGIVHFIFAQFYQWPAKGAQTEAPSPHLPTRNSYDGDFRWGECASLLLLRISASPNPTLFPLFERSSGSKSSTATSNHAEEEEEKEDVEEEEARHPRRRRRHARARARRAPARAPARPFSGRPRSRPSVSQCLGV